MRLEPPIDPMLAKAVATIPAGMVYEPKWDGFRCLVFRDRDDVVLLSRGGKDLAVYFPEVVAALLDHIPPRCVLDGELIIIRDDRLDFEALTARIHPAASRVERLAEETPASFVAFDVLALDGDILMKRPLRERRAALERALAHADAPIHLCPQTLDQALAQTWFAQFEGAGLDGVIAKDGEGTYQPGKRAMLKIKHQREADVVIAGWTEHKDSTPELPMVGSLQLGLYDDDGGLWWVGACSSFTAARRAELAAELGSSDDPEHPWAGDPVDGGPRRPGAVSRWSKGTKAVHLVWPLRVATVAYDHMEGLRFRHNPSWLRWRPDREPRTCGFDQLEEPVSYRLADVLG